LVTEVVISEEEALCIVTKVMNRLAPWSA